MKTIFVATCLSIFILSGCTPIVKPDNDPVRKHVEACGSGFESKISSKLLVEYDIEKAELQGQADAGIEASTKTATAIMQFLPEADRLEGYKIYTKCLTDRISYPKDKAPPPTPSVSIETSILICRGDYSTGCPPNAIWVDCNQHSNKVGYKKAIELCGDLKDILVDHISATPGGRCGYTITELKCKITS